MKNITSKLPQFNLHNKRVLLRADLNVPIVDEKLADDFRLRALQPTLDFIHKQDAIIFIATHLGRPNGSYNSKLSTHILIPWFTKNNYEIIFEQDLHKAANTDYTPGAIILLENLRFFSGEQNHDNNFAQLLASISEYYVNDAFGALHRKDTSLTLVAQLFDEAHKTIGFLVEKELQHLSYLKESPKKPFVLIIGGGKIETKVELIQGMLDTVSSILLCPAVVFTFLKAQGKSIGKSLIDDTLLATAQEIIKQAQHKKVVLHFPVDYQIARGTLQGELEYSDAEQFPDDGFGISIGPKTCNQWKSIISDAQTIFINAAMGFADRPDTLSGLHTILKTISSSQAYSVAGGGDTVAALERFRLLDAFSFVSTGGGATLAYISGKQLPGLLYI